MFQLGKYLERVESAIREDDEYLYAPALRDASRVLNNLGFSEPRGKIDDLVRGIGAGLSPIHADAAHKTYILGILSAVKSYVDGALA